MGSGASSTVDTADLRTPVPLCAWGRALLRVTDGETVVWASRDDIVDVVRLGAVLVSVSSKALKVWDAATGACLHCVEGLFRCVSAADNVLFSGGQEIVEWDIKTGSRRTPFLGRYPVVTAIMARGAEKLAAGSMDALRIWQSFFKNSDKVWTCVAVIAHSSPITHLQCFSSMPCSCCRDGTVHIYDMTKMAIATTLPSSARHMTSIDATKRFLVAGAKDATIRVFLHPSTFFDLPKAHTAIILCLLVFSTNLLLSASGDKTLRLWSLDHRTHLATSDLHYEVAGLCLLRDDPGDVVLPPPSREEIEEDPSSSCPISEMTVGTTTRLLMTDGV